MSVFSKLVCKTFLFGLLLCGTHSQGQPLNQAQNGAAKPTTSSRPTTSHFDYIPEFAALNPQEKDTLSALFTKARPATLRIEQCPVKNCVEPDGLGSGVLISEDGLALTAYHVVFQARSLSAVTSDKKRYAVEVIGYDDQHDLALLRVNVPAGTPYLPLAQKAPVVADPVLAIGNGGGQFLRPKTGRLLALNAQANRADFPPGTLQLSAALIPGDSGGPILNAAGEVTGIVSYIRASTADGEPTEADITAYAVPVTATDSRIADLKNGSKKDAPIIGVTLDGNFALLSALPEKLFAQANKELGLQLGTTPGAFFTSVRPNSPAAKAGLQALRYDRNDKLVRGDLVTAVNGKRVVNFSEFQYAVRAYAPGDTVNLSVVRAGKTITLPLTLVGRSTINN